MPSIKTCKCANILIHRIYRTHKINDYYMRKPERGYHIHKCTCMHTLLHQMLSISLCEFSFQCSVFTVIAVIKSDKLASKKEALCCILNHHSWLWLQTWCCSKTVLLSYWTTKDFFQHIFIYMEYCRIYHSWFIHVHLYFINSCNF